MRTLHVESPEQIIYTTDQLTLTVLGGIRLDGLDRLRVTLKIEVTNREHGEYLNNAELAALAIRLEAIIVSA